MKISLKTASASVATKTEERKYVSLSQVISVTVTALTEKKSAKGNVYFVIEVADSEGGTHDGMLINLSGKDELAVGDAINCVCTLTQIQGKWSRKVIV